MLKKRPLCVFSCFLIIFIIISYELGIKDDVTWKRQQLRAGSISLKTVAEWEEIAVSGRIRRITRTEEKVSLRLSDVKLEDTGLAVRDRQSEELGAGYYVQAAVQGSFPELETGSWVKVTGKVIYPAAPTCPGQYDMLLNADLNRILFSLVSAHIQYYAVDQNTGTMADRLKAYLAAAYGRVLSEEDAGIMTAVTLGDKTFLSDEIRCLFQDGGISHILAISGLHIQLVGMSLYRLLRKRRMGFSLCAVISGFLLVFYCIMTGMSRSAVRAVVMFVLWTGSQITGRTPDTLSSLAAAACIVLLRSPASIKDGGFQMSFGCILSIYFLSPPMQELLHWKDTGKWRDNLKGMLASSLAVTIGTLPICCTHYYQFSPMAPLLNIIVLPSMSVVVMTGFAGACAGMLCLQAGLLIVGPCHYLLKLFIVLCRLGEKLPFFVVVTGCPHIWQVMIYYTLLAMLLLFRDKLYWQKSIQIILLLTANVFLLCMQIAPSVRLIFLDVGQGDCVIIQTGRTALIVDGGSSSVDGIWQYRLQPCLKYYGIRTVDGWFATHGDLDHINGIEACAQTYQQTWAKTGSSGITVSKFYISTALNTDQALQSLVTLFEEHGVESAIVNKGTCFRSAIFTLQVLYPSEVDLCENSNENSLVLLLETGASSAEGKKDQSMRVLLTGDLEKEGEENFRNQFQNLGKIHILKLGHHGSRYATSELFLETFNPDVAVISCGLHNRYGHPSPYTLERLSEAGTEVLRTDMQGSILWELHRGGWKTGTYS